MHNLESLNRRINSGKGLHSIVRTMKALAAVSIWQYEQAVESLAEYNRTVEKGLQALLRDHRIEMLIPPTPAQDRLGAIVFGSDQGMCGPFNDNIAEYAVSQMDSLGIAPEERIILAIGQRALSQLEARRQAVSDYLSVPSVLAGVTPRVQDVLLKVEEWRSKYTLNRITLFFNHPLSSVSYRSRSLQLFPLDPEWLKVLKYRPWPSRSLPLYSMDYRRLFSSLVREYIFVSAYRAFAESLASENAARLASMQAAERNIEERLEQLNMLYHQVRQSSITEEILDIMSGFEALTSNGIS